MLFVELRFFVFLAVVMGVYWSLPGNRMRKFWLVGASYFFYAAWDYRFLTLILLSTAIDYIVGLKLDSTADPSRRKHWVMLSVAGNLSILGFFKYFNFFTESFIDLANLLGMPVNHTTLAIVLPVGISFYTFQTMSYSLDIYFGVLKPTRSLLDLALFVAFFPQLVAGPIVRARQFLPQLETRRVFLSAETRGFMLLFLAGFIKKACVSDNLAPFVDQYFADPVAYTAASAWTAVLFYAVQIYCDFSGYSDMAIACAGLLGFRLCDNFNFPYLSRSITDFWRRWHMSLSSWLKDYLYIPLGGRSGSKLRTYRNLMLTMLLGGLWHGAAWNFVIWGGMHGGALIVHKEWMKATVGQGAIRRLGHLLGPFMTFYWVCLTWIFFRAVGFDTAFEVLKSFVLLRSDGSMTLDVSAGLILAVLIAVHWMSYMKVFDPSWRRIPMPVFATAYGAVFALAIALVPMDHRPFIYFQF